MARRQDKSKKLQPGRLRIVAGNWRSRLLDIADVEGLRPTSERIRETLFNWLAPILEGAHCLDLFAGTGALGLEALSRGAASVVFVDTSRKATATLEKNIESLGARGARVELTDARDYLRSTSGGPFDVVFLDPPFAGDMLGTLCRELDECGVCAPGAYVYLEEDRARALPELPAGWAVFRERTAGNVRYALVTTTRD